MNLIIFFPLILGTATGLILLLIAIHILKQHQPEIVTLYLHPVPPSTTPLPVVKTPIIDECSHNQTLDSGILCLPNDTKLLQQYNGAPTI